MIPQIRNSSTNIFPGLSDKHDNTIGCLKTEKVFLQLEAFICKKRNVDVNELRSDTRTEALVTPRHELIWLLDRIVNRDYYELGLRTRTVAPLKVIGRICYNFDH